MKKNEYANIFQFEKTYWWYTILDEIVFFWANKSQRSHYRKILDIGCGTGRVIELLGPLGKVSGFDYAKEAIDFCKKRTLRNVWQADVNEWKPTKERYDLIVSLDVLYHKAVQDDTAVLEQMYNGLKSGGTLILQVPAFSILKRRHDKQVSGVRRYRRKDMVSRLEGLGFHIEKATYRLPHAFIMLLGKKMLEKWSGDQEAKSDLQALPAFVNTLFVIFGHIENYLLRYMSFPFGSSLFIVAKKV